MVARLFIRVGWLLFAAGWVPFAGIFISLIGTPPGSYSWPELPTLTRFSLIATGITFGFSMVLILGSQFASRLLGPRDQD